VVAAYRTGTVTRAELEGWRRFLELDRRRSAERPREALIGELILLEVLEQRFDAAGLSRDPGYLAERRRLERRLASRELRRWVVRRSLLSEAELRAAYEAEPERWHRPRTWRLENVFKRFPPESTEADRRRLRREMAAIRERIVAGADFAEVARRESESETRVRGGRMGRVTLDRLAPEVAEAVKELGEGELSPVIETPEGLTLLRCTERLEPRRRSFEEVRGRIERSLEKARVATAWEALDRRLLAELPAGERGEDALLAARAAEAERLGLLAAERYRTVVGGRSRELRARTALEAEASRRVAEPTEGELRALYAARRELLKRPERAHLRLLEVPIDPELPPELYERVRRFGEALAAGEMAFEEAAEKLRPHARLEELGWKTEKQWWLMGRNVQSELAELGPGESSGVAQEGRSLYLLHVVDREPERPQSFEEARPLLREALRTVRRRRAAAELEAEILAAAREAP
jgi:hypothetical protein